MISDDLSGFWQHAKHNFWIEIAKGTGILLRNARFPDPVCRTFLTNIAANQLLISEKIGFIRPTVERKGSHKVPAF